MEEIGGANLIHFVDHEYVLHAWAVFDSLDIQELTFENIWHVFTAMLPLM